MIHALKNQFLSVQIEERGAELQSLKRLDTGEEFLWQGDPAVWSGHSPLLFPIVGKLYEDAYIYGGRRYSMPKHGFARKSLFEARRVSDEKIAFVLESGEYKENYPFDFCLSVTYSLEKDTLHVTHRVENKGNSPMYFSLGAHPAFQCELGDALIFPDDDMAHAYRLTKDMLLSECAQEVGIQNHRLTVTRDIFKEDALIFEGLRSECATLMRADGRPRVTVEFGAAPCLGVWAKPGAAYVCIEPWYGVDSKLSDPHALQDKPHIVHLAPGCCFRFPMWIHPHKGI